MDEVMCKRSFIIFLIIYLGYQFFSLSLQPIPWFDETFFASIAHNYWQEGGFVPEISATVMHHKPILIYGPIYFVTTSLSFKILGFGVWQFRVVNLLCGFAVVFIVLLLKNQFFKQDKFEKFDWLWLILIFLDPFFNLCLHEGRMDLMALLFMLSGIYFYIKSLESKQFIHYVLVGFFVGLAMLTTPRVGFIGLALAIVIIGNLFQKKIGWREIGLMIIPFLLLFSLWINYCGGFIQYLSIWGNGFDSSGGGNNIFNYIFPILYIPRHEYLLIFFVAIFLVWGFIAKISFLKNSLIQISFLSILLFYVLVKDWGPYSIFILFFYYLIFIYLYDKIISKYKLYFLVILIFFNAVFFGLKVYQTILGSNVRNPIVASDFIKKHIPQGSKVIGDATYYYAVVQNNCKYQYIDKYGTLKKREQVLRENFGYQYVIVSDIEKNRYLKVFDYFAQKQTLKPIARLSLPIPDRVPFISSFDEKAYSCTIYKVVK